MRTKKRTFPHFQYRECDRFADYLHEQSLQGWHFKEWRFGLVFEKGKPQDIAYGVEVFPKASEMDLKPGENTQEYAEYCLAAGWILLDSHEKFCVFRKMKEEAVPIVENAERLNNIKKAEWEKWRGTSIVCLILTGLYLFEFWTFNFGRWIFSNSMIFLLATFCIMAVEVICEGIGLIVWERKQKRRLNSSQSVIYGKRKFSIVKWRYFFLLVICFQLLNMDNMQQYGMAALLAVVIGGLGLISLIVSFWRPLAVENSVFQLFAAMGIMVVVGTWIFTGVFEKTMQSSTREELKEIPLLQSDYREIKGTPEALIDRTESVFGYSYRGEVSYYRDETTVENSTEKLKPIESDSGEEYLQYEVYHSPYKWVIDRVWEEEYRECDTAMESKESWNSEKAYRDGRDGRYWYSVKYPKDVLIMHIEADQELDEDDITIIQEKLGINK